MREVRRRLAINSSSRFSLAKLTIRPPRMNSIPTSVLVTSVVMTVKVFPLPVASLFPKNRSSLKIANTLVVSQLASYSVAMRKIPAIVAGIRINQPIDLKRLGNKSLWFIKKVDRLIESIDDGLSVEAYGLIKLMEVMN